MTPRMTKLHIIMLIIVGLMLVVQDAYSQQHNVNNEEIGNVKIQGW